MSRRYLSLREADEFGSFLSGKTVELTSPTTYSFEKDGKKYEVEIHGYEFDVDIYEVVDSE